MIDIFRLHRQNSYGTVRAFMFPGGPYLRNLLLVSIFIAAGVSGVSGQNTLIPVTTRRDMVFDHSGAHLYISRSDGLVQRYNVATSQIDNSYSLGGSLNGID